MEEVLNFISRRFKQDCDWITGNCYYFAIILKERFPNGRIWYDVIEGHFVYEIEGNFYDWTGFITTKDNIKYIVCRKFIPWDKMDEYDIKVKERIIRDCIL